MEFLINYAAASENSIPVTQNNTAKFNSMNSLDIQLQTGTQGVRSLKTWTFRELMEMKQTQLTEEDLFLGGSGKTARWRGVLISQLIEAALKTVSPEQRAMVDLVVIETKESGPYHRVLIPRHFIVKYPAILAVSKNGKSLEQLGLQSVAPLSKEKIQKEALPVKSYFLENVQRVVLTNYKIQFGNLFLKKRTDPAAVRGEKLFVQTCLSCHSGSGGPLLKDVQHRLPAIDKLPHEGKSKAMMIMGHVLVNGFPKFQEKEQKSLLQYFEAFQTENATNKASPETAPHAFRKF